MNCTYEAIRFFWAWRCPAERTKQVIVNDRLVVGLSIKDGGMRSTRRGGNGETASVTATGGGVSLRAARTIASKMNAPAIKKPQARLLKGLESLSDIKAGYFAQHPCPEATEHLGVGP